MSNTFSKIWILVILIILAVGGIFAWQYFGKQGEEPNTSEVAKDETAGWQTYRSEEYGFEVEYPQRYTVDESFAIEIKGPNDLSIFIQRFDGGLISMGEVIVKEEQLSLADYLDYYYRKTVYENPPSGAYKILEYKDIMNSDYFISIPNKNKDIEIWRQRLTENLEGFESTAYLMDKNKTNTIVRFSWHVISYEHDEIFGEYLLKQFNQILSTFSFFKVGETADWQIYQNEIYGFKVKYPENWKVKSSLTEGIEIKNLASGSYFTIIENKNEKELTLDEWFKELTIINGRPTVKASAQPTFINSIKAYRLDSELESPNPLFEIVGIADSQRRIFTLFAYSGELGNNKILEQMLSTFRFLEAEPIKVLLPKGGK